MNLIINCSPKLKYSSTEVFINKIKNKDDAIVYLYKTSFDLINIEEFDCIIFASPLYADSPSSKLIEFMEYIKDNNINLVNKYIYFISNSGFIEYEQNYVSDKIMNNFCNNNYAIFMGYLNIGSGPALGELNKNIIYKILSIPLFIKLKIFKYYINKLIKIELNTRMFLPRFIYNKCANRMWNKYN